MTISPFQRNFAYLVLYLIISFLFTGCLGNSPPAEPQGPEKNLIQIVVRDDISEHRLPGAMVRLTIASTIFPAKRTDDNGLAAFEVDESFIDNTGVLEVELKSYDINRQVVVVRNTEITEIWMVKEGATAVPRETPTNIPISPTPQPDDTNTPTPTDTATAVPPTHTPIPILATPSEIPSTPQTTATAVLSASIFTQPNVNSEELTFIDIGETVLVLDEQGSWMRVRNDDGIEGWAAKSRFQPPSDGITAVVNLSVTIFSGPGESYSQITFLNPDTEITVLGRSANASWLNIFTADLIEGWVAASRITLDRDISEIPVVDESVIPDLNEPPGNLTLDFWDLDGSIKCTSSGWEVSLFLEGHGGNGLYTYFVNGTKIAGPKPDSYTYSFNGGGNTSLIISGTVTSGDGFSTSKNILISPPTCN